MREEIVSCTEAGYCRNITQVARHHRVPRSTLQDWQREYPSFDVELQAAWKGITLDEGSRVGVPDFETFREECFGHPTFEHQREWLEAIDRQDMSIILVPPEHAKTMTLSIEYPTWRITKDRNVRIISVSKSQTYARKLLLAVKKRLSDHSLYRANGWRSPIREWGPFEPGERERGRLPWSADMFYVSGIDSSEKDPTMEALGVGGQIYGARADVIVLDDIATLKNQQSITEREKILEWLAQEVLTRLADDGKLILIGTRVHENDIYSTLLAEDIDWATDFHAVVQQAIIDEENRRTLWPERWPYDKLVAKRRNRMPLRQWNLVYQQSAQGSPDNPFSPEALDEAKDISVRVGQLAPGLPVVMGVDPALEGTLAISVVGIDRGTGERHLIDCIGRTQVRHPDIVKNLIVETATRYGASRCRIEKNAMQGFLSKDAELRRRLVMVGCQLEEEYTTAQNKYDPEWGISSVAAQFDLGLWHIPWAPGSETKMRPLLEELASWRPGVKVKQDRVVSLWLAELSARRFASYRPGLPTSRPDVPTWVRHQTVPRWMSHGYAS